MEIDPNEVVASTKSNTGADSMAPKTAWLNPAVAITVALLATFMGIYM